MIRLLLVLSCLTTVFVWGSGSFDGRITGGSLANIKTFPFIASLRKFDSHKCGASIINNRTVVTAAHCIVGQDPRLMSIRVGKTNNKLGTQYKFEKAIIHKDFNFGSSDYDIGILKTSTDIVFSESVKPIQLQPKNQDVEPGNEAVVAGWGIMKSGEKKAQDLLRSVSLKVISNEDCKEMYSGKITENMLCTFTPGHDACQGDSGGPLASAGKLIGVVSWGYGCGDTKYPGVYTKVAALHDWIKLHM